MDHAIVIMALLVVVALIFDFMNGFHDAANSVALMVSTRLLTPQAAVVWAAFFNLIAFLFFGLHVANTVGKGIINKEIIDNAVIFGALSGAISWNLITWWFGIPSSSSHALVGGLVGAGVAKAGPSAIVAAGLIKTSVAIILSPLFGMLLALILMILVLWIVEKRSPYPTERVFNKLQFISSSLYSLGHGGNDAQKTMGMGITRIRPSGGFCAQTSGAIALFIATSLGIPVSTTHTITGAIIGVGLSRRVSSVRLGLASRIIWAWVLTIPCAGLLAAASYHFGKAFL